MRRGLTLIGLAMVAAAAWAGLPGRVRHGMSSPLGSATMADVQTSAARTEYMLVADLPPGQHQAFTVVTWWRLWSTNAYGYITTGAHWCGDPIQRSHPDLAAGAFGFQAASGTNLTAAGGSVTIASFPFEPYTSVPAAVSNRWPMGVYSAAGWSDEAVTLSLGGTDYTLGPGHFDQTCLPGPSTNVVLSGAGRAAVGIARTPCAAYHMEIDGVRKGETMALTAASVVTNEVRMAVYRFAIQGAEQVYRSDLGGLAAFDVLSLTRTNAAPASGCFDSRGDYRIGLIGLGSGDIERDLEWFDSRILPWWVSDADLQRIHADGVTEILRRAIPIIREE